MGLLFEEFFETSRLNQLRFTETFQSP